LETGFRSAPVGVAGVERVGSFVLRGEVVEPRVQASVVVSVDPPHQREFDIGHCLERRVSADDFGLEQADSRLGECIVLGIAKADLPCKAQDSVNITEVY
jgi:hypothetical protein